MQAHTRPSIMQSVLSEILQGRCGPLDIKKPGFFFFFLLLLSVEMDLFFCLGIDSGSIHQYWTE